MPAADPGPARDRKGGLFLAFAGALAGAGAVAVGLAAKRRQQASGPDPYGGETGRGIPATPPSPQARRQGFETSDMSAALMGTLTIGLGVTIAISIVLMVVLTSHFQAGRRAVPALTAQQVTPLVPPLPHLQAAPLLDIATLRAREAAALDGQGWTDPAHRSARIPIGVAIGQTVGQSLDAAP